MSHHRYTPEKHVAKNHLKLFDKFKIKVNIKNASSTYVYFIENNSGSTNYDTCILGKKLNKKMYSNEACLSA